MWKNTPDLRTHWFHYKTKAWGLQGFLNAVYFAEGMAYPSNKISGAGFKIQIFLPVVQKFAWLWTVMKLQKAEKTALDKLRPLR